MAEAAPLNSGMRNLELKMAVMWDLYRVYISMAILDGEYVVTPNRVFLRYSDK